MPHARVRVRPSPFDWAVRGLLAVAAVAAGIAGVTCSLAQVLARSGNAAAGHRIAPFDGRIAAQAAAALSGPEATGPERGRSDALARAALRRDPTAITAVSTLGSNALVRGDAAAAGRSFAYAQVLSRRDPRTQLWAIEDAVSRGDVAGALRNYDIALRTRPGLWDTLFPVLASASADPAIRAALIRTLAGDPLWGEGFVYHVVARGPGPRPLAAFLLGLRRAGVAVPDSAHASAIDGLLAADLTREAWTYYLAIRSGADRRSSRDPRFGAGLDAPSQFDWVAINDGGVATSLQGGVADFTAPASIGGVLLRQSQMLPAGEYGLAGHSTGIEQVEDARPYWVLTCKDGRELDRVVLPNSAQGDGRFAGTFRVPPGCPVQMLALVARPSDAVGGLAGQIDRVQLAPLR